MSVRIVIVGLLATCFSFPIPAAEPTRQGRALVLSDCLDPGRARSWHLIDHDEILVDAGRRHYHLKLTFSCPELTYNHTIGFRAANGIGRVCGHRGDAIITPRPSLLRWSCTIAVVTPLDQAQFNGYLTRKKQKDADARSAESSAVNASHPPTDVNRFSPD